jgi:hypothetical protein
MAIAEIYDGSLEEYRGRCVVLVTDADLDKNQYHYLKYKLLKRKVELICIHQQTDAEVGEFISYLSNQERRRQQQLHKGRVAFGFTRNRSGEEVEDPERIAVARRVVRLRDAGLTYQKIVDDPEVRYPDGRKMSVSTIQVILKNRSKYE